MKKLGKMIDFKKEQIKKAGYCFFLATTCGILGDKIHLPELIAAWGIGGVVLEGFFHTLRDLFVVKGAHRISEGLPSKVNRDLERAIKSSYKNTINDLIEDTIILCDLNEPFISKVNNFIRNESSESEETKKRLKETFFEPLLNSLINEEEISKMLENNQQLKPDEYLKKIISDKSLSFYYEEGAQDHIDFVNFISKKFAEHFREHFKTELKNDERAKTVYITTVEETILRNTEIIKGDTAIIKGDTAEIRSKLDSIQLDINLLLSKSKGDISESNDKMDDSNLPKEIEDSIEQAIKATRIGNFEQSKEIWIKIEQSANAKNNPKLSIRARLEIARLDIREDYYNLDIALKIANDCLSESKKINLGNQVGHVLQLLGEIHRLLGNNDQARGFLNAALEFSISKNDKNSEGWALLALGKLSNENKESFDVQLNYTNKAYDAFTNLLVSGGNDISDKANDGFAMCHVLRADFYGYNRSEEALAEYSRAIAIYRKMGELWEYELAGILLERGKMQAAKDDWQHGIPDIISAETIYNKLNNPYMAAKCHLACAELVDNIGHREESEKYYRSALQKVLTIKDERKKSWFFLRYAMKLMELGEHKDAKEILLMLLSNDSITDSQKLDVLKMLSDVAKSTKNEKELKEYEEHSLLIIEKLIAEAQSSMERLRLLYNKGQTLHWLGKNELSIETFQRAIHLAESISAKSRLADIWAAIAEVYSKMKNPREERLAYEKVLNIIGDDKSSPQLVTTLTMLAQLDMKESNFDEAKKNLDRAELLCKKIMPFMMFVIDDIRQRLKEAELKENTKNKKK